MKKEILIVEDERIVAEDVGTILTNFGYAVSSIVSSGEDAIARAGEVLPDLVLMDIVLKGEMDGVEAAEQIRSTLHIPVVYLTAYADSATLKRARVTAPYGYIVKPFVDKELCCIVEMAIYKSQRENRLEQLAAMMGTIRNIDKITTEEKDPRMLIKRICEGFIETRGYRHAWIALNDEPYLLIGAGKLDASEELSHVEGRMRLGELPDCVRQAIGQLEVVTVRNPSSVVACAGCPLLKRCDGGETLTIRLEAGETICGLLSVALPADLAAGGAEAPLLTEVAGDIAFALNSIRLEELRNGRGG
jgi:CheY-like chemotaxis protein